MDNFVAANELFHIAFARTDDRYYTADLLAPNIKDYLYIELQKQGFDKCIIFDSEPTGSKLEIYDTPSLTAYLETAEKKSGFFGRKSATVQGEVAQGEKYIEKVRDLNEVSSRLCQVLSNNRNVLVILPLELFDGMYADEELIHKYSRLAKNNYKNRNAVVILAPDYTNGSLDFFERPNSIFRNEDLFPEIARIYQKQGRVSIFSELIRQMPDQIHFFNKVSYAGLVNALHQRMFRQDMNVFEPEDIRRVGDMAAVLYAWFQSVMFRKEYEAYAKVFQGIERFSVSAVMERLFSDRVRVTPYREFCDKISADLGHPTDLLEALKERYPFFDTEIAILDNNKQRRRLAENTIDGLYRIRDWVTASDRERIDAIVETLHTPVIFLNPSESQREQYAEFMELTLKLLGGVDREDLDLARYLIDALEYFVCIWGRDGIKSWNKKASQWDLAEKRMKCYRQIYAATEVMKKAQADMKDSGAELQELSQKQKTLMEKIRLFEQIHKGSITNPASAEAHQLASLKKQAVLYHDQSETIKLQDAQVRYRFSEAQAAIQRYRDNIQNLDASNDWEALSADMQMIEDEERRCQELYISAQEEHEAYKQQKKEQARADWASQAELEKAYQAMNNRISNIQEN